MDTIGGLLDSGIPGLESSFVGWLMGNNNTTAGNAIDSVDQTVSDGLDEFADKTLKPIIPSSTELGVAALAIIVIVILLILFLGKLEAL